MQESCDMAIPFLAPIQNESSVKEAAKMGGLPVLMMGFNCLLISWSGSTKDSVSNVIFFGVLGFAIILVLFSFRIRSGKIASLPNLSGLSTVFFCFSSIFLLFGNILQNGVAAGGMMSAIGLVIPTMAMLLSVNGQRGWNWLRKNYRTMTL